MFGDFAAVDTVVLPDTEYVVAQDIAKKFDYTTTEVHRIVPEMIVSPSKTPRIYYFEDVVFRDKRQMKYSQLPIYTKELMQSMELEGQCALVIDGTGVGEAVYDLYDDAGLDPLKIIFGSGNSPSVQTDRAGFASTSKFGKVSGIVVPKADLVGALQVYVQQGRLRQVAGLPFAEESRRQFQNFVGKINEKDKYIKYGNLDDEIHDDMVVTSAMACWFTQHMKKMLSVRPASPKLQRQTYNINPFKEDEKAWR